MKKNARHLWIVSAICGGTALLFIALLWRGDEYEPLQKLEFFTQDMRAEFRRQDTGGPPPRTDRY